MLAKGEPWNGIYSFSSCRRRATFLSLCSSSKRALLLFIVSLNLCLILLYFFLVRVRVIPRGQGADCSISLVRFVGLLRRSSEVLHSSLHGPLGGFGGRNPLQQLTGFERATKDDAGGGDAFLECRARNGLICASDSPVGQPRRTELTDCGDACQLEAHRELHYSNSAQGT